MDVTILVTHTYLLICFAFAIITVVCINIVSTAVAMIKTTFGIIGSIITIAISNPPRFLKITTYTVNIYMQVTGIATGENFAFFIYRHFVEIL